HAAPAVVRYQGTLTDASGGAVAAGALTMSFTLFANGAAVDGESPLFQSGDTTVDVAADGTFSAPIDLSTANAAALLAAPHWFLALTVGGDALAGRHEIPA